MVLGTLSVVASLRTRSLARSTTKALLVPMSSSVQAPAFEVADQVPQGPAGAQQGLGPAAGQVDPLQLPVLEPGHVQSPAVGGRPQPARGAHGLEQAPDPALAQVDL